MKLLLDQGLPRSAAELLRLAGVDAIHVGEIGLASADDQPILAVGLTQQRIVVTLDADFHAMMALSGATQPSVIRIRIEGLRGDVLCRVLLEVLAKCQTDLEVGALVSVRLGSIGIKKLPLQ